MDEANICRGRLARYSAGLLSARLSIRNLLYHADIQCPQGLGSSNLPRGAFLFYNNFLIPMQKYLKNKLVISNMSKNYHVVIEQDEDGIFVGKVPELHGCLSQGDTLDELMKNIKEAIELCLEVLAGEKQRNTDSIKFVGVQQIEV